MAGVQVVGQLKWMSSSESCCTCVSGALGDGPGAVLSWAGQRGGGGGAVHGPEQNQKDVGMEGGVMSAPLSREAEAPPKSTSGAGGPAIHRRARTAGPLCDGAEGAILGSPQKARIMHCFCGLP